MKRLRPFMSSSLRAERLHPPWGRAPILPISISVFQRRSRFTVSSLPMIHYLSCSALCFDSNDLAPRRTESVGGWSAQKDRPVPHDRDHFGDVLGTSSQLHQVFGLPDQLL